jgi:hypothetical protein
MCALVILALHMRCLRELIDAADRNTVAGRAQHARKLRAFYGDPSAVDPRAITAEAQQRCIMRW